ncbi:cache domain-containing sensor histidine kinase [Paenibacillus tarimensis]|uniref:cache domain-containing sensor histidine kinase n=1 Tax=Paenibacillus tarimensis TaxID=416012 RepID=UPI001F2B670A|nr:sensor histidine kinase [Paenibacillus tarimensis]MCF2943341.1 sensor histidine kinase [Paenibacillus tarimensis]
MPRLKTLYQQLRIKFKLFVLISAVMLTVGVLIVLIQQYAFEIYDEEIYEQSAKALNLTSVGIENELRKMEQLSFRIATDESIQSNLTKIRNGGSQYDNFLVSAQIRERMIDLGVLDQYVLSYQITDAFNGEYSSGVNRVTTTGKQLRRIKRETANNDGGNTWILPNEDDSALGAARLIRSFDQLSLEQLGTIMIRIDMERLIRNFSLGLNRQADFIILNGDRAVYPLDPPETVAGLSALGAGEQGFRIIDRDGKRYFMTYVPSEYTSWTYLTMIPYDDIFDRIATVKQLSIVLFGALFLAAVIFSFRFSKGITDPIERLNAKMKRVQMGNFTYTEDPDDKLMPMDEAGQLHRNFRIMLQRIDELIKENYVKQLSIKESEFKMLQAQINPHFLYNTLETINWTAKMGGQKQISVMVESLGYLLRSSIGLKEPLIPLEQELDIVSHYINIQKIRFEERLAFELDIPGHLKPYSIPKLSLQPLVENAVNYGLEQMLECCQIKVSASDEGDYILLSVEDNGPGMDESLLEQLNQGVVKPKGTGVGLRNINERVKLLFGESYGLSIRSKRGEGTCVSIRLPKEVRDSHV